MKVLVLPGFSAHNKQWAKEISEKLKPIGEVSRVSWEHWQTGSASPHWIDKELEKIRPLVSRRYPISLVAKSIGTLVAAKLIDSFPQSFVDRLVLCGIPINDLGLDSHKAYQALKKIPANKILVLQNNLDPHGTYQQVVEMFKALALPDLEIVSQDAGNHEYPYFQTIKDFLTAGS